MTARWALAAALPLLAVASTSIGSEHGASPSRADGSIVVSPAGVPLAGIQATVMPAADLLNPTSVLSAATTGDDGRLRLEPPSREAVCVLVGSGWRATMVRFPLPASIKLTPGRDVPFQLMGPQGGVAGAAQVPLSGDTSLVVLSDKGGKGMLPGLPLEPVEVRAVAGALTGKARVVPRDETAVVHVARQASVLSGRVLSEDGLPAPRARVVLEAANSSGSGYSFRETSTDSQGFFRLERVKAGHHRLEVAAPEALPHVVHVEVDGAGAVVVPTIRLRPGPRLEVQFVDSQTGEPIAQPHVVTESAEPRGFSMRQLARTVPDWVGDSEGRVHIDSLAEGPLRLALDTPPWARTRVPTIEVPPFAEVLDLGVFEVGPGANLEVTVVGGGRSPQGIAVMLDRGPALSPLRPALATTDDRGQATFDRLGPGRYRLRVGADGYAGRGVLWERWFSVEREDKVLRERVDLRFVDIGVAVRQVFSSPGGLDLTLVGEEDPSGGPPEPPIRVAGAGSGNRLLNAPLARVSRAVTDADGRAQLRRVMPGQHRLIVDFGGSNWSTPLTIGTTDGESLLTVPPAATWLLVSDPSGRPMPTARAEWRTSAGTRSSATASADGMVGLLGMGEEGGVLRVWAPGFATAVLVAASPAELPATVVLDPVAEPAAFRLQVTDEAGMPLTAATVGVVQRGDAERHRHALTDPEGIARIGDLASGRAEVRVQRAGYAPSLDRVLDLVPGHNQVAPIALTTGFRINVVREAESRPGASPYRLRLYRFGGPRVDSYLDDASLLTVVPGGSVSIGPLAPGVYTLELRTGNSLHESRTVHVEDADVDVTLR